jgi:hypothetical protein
MGRSFRAERERCPHGSTNSQRIAARYCLCCKFEVAPIFQRCEACNSRYNSTPEGRRAWTLVGSKLRIPPVLCSKFEVEPTFQRREACNLR